VISEKFALNRVVELCDEDRTRGIDSFDDLSIGDYERLLQNPAAWATLGWPLDRVTFIARLTSYAPLETRSCISILTPCPREWSAKFET